MTAVALIQRCMVVFAILLVYVHARGEKDEFGIVDCERYPFHHSCRGMMSRKRAMLTNSANGLDCDGNRGGLDCIKMRSFGERRHVPYVALPKSKLWMTLLDDDLQKDSPYDAYDVRHRKRKNNEVDRQYDERRIPLVENFLSELDVSDNDY